MLKSAVSTLDHPQFVASVKHRYRGRGRGPLFGFPCDYTVLASPSGNRNLRKCIASQRVHAGRRRELSISGIEGGGRLDAIKGLKVELPGMAEGTHSTLGMAESSCFSVRTEHANGERCLESQQQEGLNMDDCLPDSCSRGYGESAHWPNAQAREHQEALSYKEMMERWDFLKHLPHKLLRDVGYVIVGPSLLLNSTELPMVSTRMLGASRNQWADTKAWLQQLSVPTVEAWFASHRPSNRLGDHFALCIEFVLRHSPLVEARRLLTSQQVLQRVAKPARAKAWSMVQPELVPLPVRTVHNDGPESPLGPPAALSQPEYLAPEGGASTLTETTLLLESTDLADKNSKTPAGTSQEKLGKRRRKLLRKLERIRLRRGNTTTIGEFDFLFEAPSVHGAPTSGSVGAEGEKEYQHWEVSVKYLLYAGPWEVFGVKTLESAAWSNREMEDGDGGTGPPGREDVITGLCDTARIAGVARPHSHCSTDEGGFYEPEFTTTSAVVSVNAVGVHRHGSGVGYSGRHSSVDNDSVEELGAFLDSVRAIDEFLGCFLGPHVGETLLDRKARLRNQLALSAHPCAALMLRSLFAGEASDEPVGSVDDPSSFEPRKDHGEEEGAATAGLIAPVPPMETATSSASVARGRESPAASDDRQEVGDSAFDEDEVVEGTEPLNIAPRALLKGYLFYEYKLWCFLESQRQKDGSIYDPPLSASKLHTSTFKPSISALGNTCTLMENPCIQDEANRAADGVNNYTIGLEKGGEAERKVGAASEVDASTQGDERASKASLNLNHWIGWWTRDIMEFASLPLHRHSMWYIVPKLEWLSPVIVPGSEVDRCARVLSLHDFVAMAARVADEAAKLHMPRKRRFLVAELRWDSEWRPRHEGVSLPDCVNPSSNTGEITPTTGAWLEVSRGFVVEETWPVSRSYRPHGYVASWSPSLQQHHLDIPDM